MAFKCPSVAVLGGLGGPEMSELLSQYQHAQKKRFSDSSAKTAAMNWRLWVSFCERTGAPILPLSKEARDLFLLDNALRGVGLASVDAYRRTLAVIHKMAGEAFPWPAEEAVELWNAAQKRAGKEDATGQQPENVINATSPENAPENFADQSMVSKQATPVEAPLGCSDRSEGAASPSSSSRASPSPLDMAQVDWISARRDVNASRESLVRILETGPSSTQRISAICRVVETLANIRDAIDGVKVLRPSAKVSKSGPRGDSPLTFDVSEVQRRLCGASRVVDQILATQLLQANADVAALHGIQGHLEWCVLTLQEVSGRSRDGVGDAGKPGKPANDHEGLDQDLSVLNERVRVLEQEWKRARAVLVKLGSAVWPVADG